MRAKIFLLTNKSKSMMRLSVMLALIASAFASQAAAQGRATPSLTSEDLLDRVSAYGPAAVASSAGATSAPTGTPVGGLYRDPTGAFSLNFPSSRWSIVTRSQDKGRLSDLRVFRKLDGEGFTSATLSVYVVSSGATLPVEQAARLDAQAQQTLARALTARFLSSNADVITAGVSERNTDFQVVADQLLSNRAAVRALIYALAREGKLYIVVCRTSVESFDAEAREFWAITQSFASSVARSS
jgi:hypothetical protein